MTQEKLIENAVDEFLGGTEYVYADPDSIRYQSSFYGDASLCKLNKEDLCSAINIVISETEILKDDLVDREIKVGEAIASVLDDMMFVPPAV